MKWLASELDCMLAVGDYNVQRRAAPSVMGLSPAPSVLARQSTLGDGVTVVRCAGLFSWSDGRRILRSCWMVWDCAMDSLVVDETVPPRAVSVSVAWMIVRSVSEIVGVAQCVG